MRHEQFSIGALKARAVEASAGITGNLTGNVTGNVAGNVTGSLTGSPILPTFTVAQLPTAAAGNAGTLVRCSNGAAGSPCLAMSNGTSWLRIALGAAVATT